jgi:hypothetical protein
MLLDELELILSGRRMEQAFDVTQVPDTMGGCQLAGGFDVGRGVFGGQLQEALKNTDALGSPVFNHQLGPGAGLRADKPGTIQQPALPFSMAARLRESI